MSDTAKTRRDQPPQRILVALFSVLLLSQSRVQAEDSSDIHAMSLEQLLSVVVSTASGVEETLADSPAAIVVINEADFAQRGYNSLMDILADLPGFDTVESGSSDPVTYYQRGYRTPFSTRTLFMINGVVDNNTWSQLGLITRQYPISNIQKVEVLYGPASVHYGPNAFLGIINVITKNADDFSAGQHQLKVRGELGSWSSKGMELSARGNLKELRYSLSARAFKSDEEDLSDRWGFLSNELYSDPDIWGPTLGLSYDGVAYGRYHDPTDNWGVLADISYGEWKAGLILWEATEGYGATYAADRGQTNNGWSRDSQQVYLQNNWAVSSRIQLESFALYRDSRVWGGWTEAAPDWREGQLDYAFVSDTQWSSDGNVYEFKQDLEFDVNPEFKLISGWRYKNSDVSKAYDIPGYWGAYSSTTPSDDPGPHGYGAAIFHSTDPTYDFSGEPRSTSPSDNRQTYTDKGVYVGSIFDRGPWRLNVGFRYDNNSLWGRSSSPRVSGIYRMNDNKTILKLVYGEGFQEPPAQQLYGGWSGRNENPNLSPEEGHNLEFILMHQGGNWLHEVSLYSAWYDNVIRESALNDASREIVGLEYRGRFEYPNFIPKSAAISGTFFYSWTEPKSDRRYDHDVGEWVDDDITLGDIAPHKINASINLPVGERWNLNLKGNFLYRANLYSRNVLVPQGIGLASRVMFDLTVGHTWGAIRLYLKVENILDKDALGPGLRTANAGNDFSQRSLGYNNSLTPLPGRSYWLSAEYTF